MKSNEIIAAYAGLVEDRIADVYTNIARLLYSDGEYVWDSSDIYYLEKYNLLPNYDFIIHVLNRKFRRQKM